MTTTEKDQMDVELHDVAVHTRAGRLTVQVPEHEVEVLRAVHGLDNIEDMGGSGFIESMNRSAADEIARLRLKYENRGSPDPVAIAFRNGARDLGRFDFDTKKTTHVAAPQAGVYDRRRRKAA